MQSAELGDNVAAWAKKEVIVVGQNDLSADLLQFPGVNRFDRGVGANGHENGSGEVAVGRRKDAGATAAQKLAGDLEVKHWLDYTV